MEVQPLKTLLYIAFTTENKKLIDEGSNINIKKCLMLFVFRMKKKKKTAEKRGSDMNVRKSYSTSSTLQTRNKQKNCW